MIESPLEPAVRCDGVVLANGAVSSGLLQLDLKLEQSVSFQPGQFAMLNLTGADSLVFSRPFSIFQADRSRFSFLYRVVGRGTAAMGALTPGRTMTFLGPLGRPFPNPDNDTPVVLIAGGVGLPPLAAWLERYGDQAPQGVRAFFGARDGGDVPWGILGDRWRVSVDELRDVPEGRRAWKGVVTDLAASDRDLQDGVRRLVLACGPTPLLKAAARLAADRRWPCWLSLEEHMGCGYGVCKGCMVPVRDPARGPRGRRHATCCEEGPVFNAADLAWDEPVDQPSRPA
jgi:dihydroorotate dehydrogenase electron transfer subunit